MDTNELLYSPEDLPRLEKKIKVERVLVWALAGLTLGLCVLFCCLTNTANAQRMELAAVVTSTLGGWCVIYRRLFGLQETRHELEHARHLLESPLETAEGTLQITKEKLRIKNSIRIRIVSLEDGEQKRRLMVNETRLKRLLPYDGQRVRLGLVGSYIAGIGGADDALS